MKYAELSELIAQNEIKFVDLRFCDIIGKNHHLTLPAHAFSEELIANGQPFDGSSIGGWQGIECSDMLLLPDLSTAKIDPFYEQNTLFITCEVFDPSTLLGYEKCPRTIARKAEKYLAESKIADTAYFGPEPEFFIFDSITYGVNNKGAQYLIESDEAPWMSNRNIEGGNMGHRPVTKGGYMQIPPIDSLQDLRSEICMALEDLGIPTEIHHHEVASSGQCEIGTRFSTLVERADWTLIFKYVVQNVAHRFGRTATFMPKPIADDNGSGMHIHQSLWRDGKNLFAGSEYAGLSQTALYYIGGIIHHAKALNAFTNPTTNSYKRLVPGFEAPVTLAYSARNRSAAIRIPYSSSSKASRIEARFPDAMANPYLSFSAMLLAGIDGIINKIEPGEAMDTNLYELTSAKALNLPKVSNSLAASLESLNQDREFLTQSGVFSNNFIDSYIKLKQKEVDMLNLTPHPLEFKLYYSL